MQTSTFDRGDAETRHSASTPTADRSTVHDDRVGRWFEAPLGLRSWAAIAAAVLATGFALVAAGLPWLAAFLGPAIVAPLAVFAARGAWHRPERYAARGLLRSAGRNFVLACLGSMIAFVVADVMQHDDLDPARLLATLAAGTRKVAPVMAAIVAIVVTLMGIVAWVRRVRLQRELALLRVMQERDAAARRLAEARLELLQRQIQPHFIFNTLAAVQHWVDVADPRAGPLLRALTSFLRGSTELLARDRTTLDVEVAIVRHYLAIMEARLGDRLRHAITIAPGAGMQALPPGVLLTIVENAIEHGISPALRGGLVAVTADDDGSSWVLRVRDDGAGPVAGWVDGVGLRNCRERLHHLFGAAASLSLERGNGETVTTVRIVRTAS